VINTQRGTPTSGSSRAASGGSTCYKGSPHRAGRSGRATGTGDSAAPPGLAARARATRASDSAISCGLTASSSIACGRASSGQCAASASHTGRATAPASRGGAALAAGLPRASSAGSTMGSTARGCSRAVVGTAARDRQGDQNCEKQRAKQSRHPEHRTAKKPLWRYSLCLKAPRG
jgi:hypothetical protein